VTFDDSTVIEKASDYPRGNPENPVETSVLERKMTDLLGPETAQAALETVHGIDSCADLATLFRRFA